MGWKQEGQVRNLLRPSVLVGNPDAVPFLYPSPAPDGRAYYAEVRTNFRIFLASTKPRRSSSVLLGRSTWTCNRLPLGMSSTHE